MIQLYIYRVYIHTHSIYDTEKQRKEEGREKRWERQREGWKIFDKRERSGRFLVKSYSIKSFEKIHKKCVYMTFFPLWILDERCNVTSRVMAGCSPPSEKKKKISPISS